MRLLSEIYRVLGAEGDASRVQYTVVDGKGGYFQNVKRLLAFSGEEIIFAGRKGSLRVKGNALSLGKYQAGDAAVFGDIFAVERLS